MIRPEFRGHVSDRKTKTTARVKPALAFIRTFYSVEREITEERETLGDTLSDADGVRVRRTRAGPILAQFFGWIETQCRRATPKS